MKHMSFYVDDKLHAKIRLHCLKSNKTATDFMKTLINKALDVADVVKTEKQKQYEEFIESEELQTVIREVNWYSAKAEYELRIFNPLLDQMEDTDSLEEQKELLGEIHGLFIKSKPKWRKFDSYGYGLSDLIAEELLIWIYKAYMYEYELRLEKDYIDQQVLGLCYETDDKLFDYSQRLKQETRSLKDREIDDTMFCYGLKEKDRRLFNENQDNQ